MSNSTERSNAEGRFVLCKNCKTYRPENVDPAEWRMYTAFCRWSCASYTKIDAQLKNDVTRCHHCHSYHLSEHCPTPSCKAARRAREERAVSRAERRNP